MNKKIKLAVLLCIIICAFAFLSITAYAEDYLYGNVVETGINAGGLGTRRFCIKICSHTGDVPTYFFADVVSINETTYDSTYDDESLANLVPVDSFVKYSLNSEGKINSLYFDDTAETYFDTLYDSVTNKFVLSNGLYTSSLPVFYVYPTLNYDTFIAPYLDENHTYDIEVYDYAIKVVDYSAIDKENTIEFISISQGIAPDFTLELNVLYSSSNSSNNYVRLHVFDEDNNEITNCINTAQQLTILLPNKSATYKITLTLEDGSSPTYTIPYTTTYVPVLSGKVVETGLSAGIPQIFLAKIENPDGSYSTYECPETIKINGDTFYPPIQGWGISVLEYFIPMNKYIRYAVIDDKIQIINHDVYAYDFVCVKYINTNKASAKGSVISALETGKQAMIYVATYEGDSLVNVTPVPLTLDKDAIPFEIPLDNISDINKFDGIKLFIWDNNLVPLCETTNGMFRNAYGPTN